MRFLSKFNTVKHPQQQTPTTGSEQPSRAVKLGVFTQYYPPDFAATGQLIEELCTYLAQQKMDVQVFTGQPSYAYNASKAPKLEIKEQVRIQRTSTTKSRKFLGRTLSGLLYSLRSALHILRHARYCDVLLLTSEPPFVFLVGYLANRIFNIPYVCLIYDLYPDAVYEFGLLPSKHWLIRFWNRVNRSVWYRAESIIVLSETMRDRVVNKCPRVAAKISIIHNWSDPTKIFPIPKDENPFAAEHHLQKKFVVLYSGNMGRCHDMETIMSAAEELRKEPVQFVFIGAGPKRQEIIDRAEAQNLKNCLFLPYQDKSILPYSLTACDLSLVSVGKGMEGVVAPSKFYSALAAGRPIAAICETHSYLRQLIADANCGAAFQPGDSKGLAAFIRALLRDPQRQLSMGNMGSNYIRNRFTPQLIGKEYLHLLEGAILKDSDLKRGIVNEEFVLFYQPIVSMQTGTICGLESLAYWQHPRRGLLSPKDFLPLADRTGFILRMGESFIRESFKRFTVWKQIYEQPLYLKVNLSQCQFFDPGLVAMLDRMMAAYHVDGNELSLDIPESVLISDGAAAMAIILQLRERRIKICLDNFGQGTTSLKFLNRFPLNAIEIERGVIERLEFDPESETLIKAITVLARNLNLDVIAEGVESPRQLAHLRSLNVEFGKGFLFAKPLIADEVQRMLQKHTQIEYIANEIVQEKPVVKKDESFQKFREDLEILLKNL